MQVVKRIKQKIDDSEPFFFVLANGARMDMCRKEKNYIFLYKTFILVEGTHK